MLYHCSPCSVPWYNMVPHLSLPYCISLYTMVLYHGLPRYILLPYCGILWCCTMVYYNKYHGLPQYTGCIYLTICTLHFISLEEHRGILCNQIYLFILMFSSLFFSSLFQPRCSAFGGWQLWWLPLSPKGRLSLHQLKKEDNFKLNAVKKHFLSHYMNFQDS